MHVLMLTPHTQSHTGCSPGFIQSEYWPRVRAVLQWLRRGGHDQTAEAAEEEKEQEDETEVAEEEWGLDGYESDTANLAVRCQHSPDGAAPAPPAAAALLADQSQAHAEETLQDLVGRYRQVRARCDMFRVPYTPAMIPPYVPIMY